MWRDFEALRPNEALMPIPGRFNVVLFAVVPPPPPHLAQDLARKGAHLQLATPKAELLCPECERVSGPTFERCPFDGARLVDITSGLMPGTVIDHRYTIKRLLGKGGMGSVYVARQHSMDRDVAIKVLHQRADGNQTSVQRFFWEVRAARRLQSPHTITVFDFGQTERGSLFLAMEYLKGSTLGTLLCSRRPLAPALALQIGIQTCCSLEEAHANGIIHRDLKPENIFLCERPRELAFVKVLDFGVAKFLEQDGREPQTRTGTVFGTPRYMSPEQANSQPVDSRSDLYSLGILLYEMLTGNAPFADDSALEILYKQVHATPTPIVELVPSLSAIPKLAATVHSLLAKARDARPLSATEVRETLESIFAALPDRERTALPEAPPEGPLTSPSIADTQESERAPGPPTPSLGVSPLRRPNPAGRSREQAAARTSLDHAFRLGQPRLLWVTGEPGLGKRRLLEALHAHAITDHQALVARGLRSTLGPGLHAVRAALDDLLQTTLLERSALRARIASHPALTPEDTDLVAHLLDFLRPSPSSRPIADEMLFPAIYRFLARLSQVSPLLLDLGLVDDCDRDTLGFLEYLSHHLPLAPARLAVAIRLTHAPSARSAALRKLLEPLGWKSPLDPALHVHIPLKRLDGLDYLDFTRTIGRGYGHLAPFLRYLSGGNPGDTLALIDALDREPEQLAAALRWDPATGHIPVGWWPAPLVDRTERELDAALAHLPPREAQLILRHAALLGPTFDISILEQSLERDSTQAAFDELETVIDALVTAGCLREQTEPSANRRLHFDTGLLRELIFHRIRSPRTLRTLHATIAETLSNQPLAERDFAAIARHWEAAGEDDEALPAWLEHARAEQVADRRRAAMVAYERAFELAHRQAQDSLALQILRDLGTLALQLGAFEDARSAFERLERLARLRSDEPILAEAESLLAEAFRGSSDFATASSLFGSSAERHRELQAFSAAGRAELNRARCLALLFRTEAAVEGFEAARAHFTRHGDVEGEIDVALELGELHLQTGSLSVAVRELKAAVAKATLRSPQSSRPHRALAAALLESELTTEALAHAQAALQNASKDGISNVEVIECLETLAAALLDERPAEARAHLERALRLREGGNSREGIGRTLVGLAEAQLLLGQHDRALELARRSSDIATAEADLRTAARALRILGMAERTLRRTDLAVSDLREAVETWTRLDLRTRERVLALRDLALCEEALERHDDARSHFESALGLARELGLEQRRFEIEALLKAQGR
jgi:serine/threonine protein kinase/tetratricopeptide (TPR) repeat protein